MTRMRIRQALAAAVVVASLLGLLPPTADAAPRQRFLLYDIPAGEGFNLRRDVLTRALLLTEDLGPDWTLVLPPFHRMVHWKNDRAGETFPWREFLDLSGLSDRVHVMEFEDYAAAHGRRVDTILQLVTGPLDDRGARIEPRACESLPGIASKYARTADGVEAAFFGGSTRVAAARVDCRFMLAPYASLKAPLESLPGDSALVDGFQIGYWDATYGSARYWDMRERVRFSRTLEGEAERFIQAAFGAQPYLSIHLRRGDFLKTNRPHPSLDEVVAQAKIAMAAHHLTRMFLATDGSPDEVAYLKARLPLDRYEQPAGVHLPDGGLAIIDQIVAAHGAYFIGTDGSTFSTVIMEDRELARRDPATTYNVLCKGEPGPDGPRFACPPVPRFARPDK
jgi:peptide-O-fucosyltransferase